MRKKDLLASMKQHLIAQAKPQAGYFTAKQAMESGYALATHTYYVKQGEWLRIDRGLYRMPGEPDCPESDFIRWCLWSRDRNEKRQAVISHFSALHYLLAESNSASGLQLTVPLSFRKRLPPEIRLYYADLGEREISVRGAFAVVSPLRALVDCTIELEQAGQLGVSLARGCELGLWDRSQAVAALARVKPDLARAFRPTGALSLSWPPAQPGPVEPLPLAAPGPETFPPLVMPNSFSRVNDSSAVSVEVEPLVAGPVSLDSSIWPPAGANSPTARPSSDSLLKRSLTMTAERDRTPAFRRRREAGFTLVELLVVTAIISVLAAMLLPVLDKAQSAARKTSCANNEKQIGTAMELYCSDYAGYFPICWGETHAYGYSSWLCDLDYYYLQTSATPTSFYNFYHKDSGVITRCPVRTTTAAAYKSVYGNMDWWIMYGLNYVYLYNGSNQLKPYRKDVVTQPSRTIMAADSTAEDGDGQVINAMWSGGYPSDRHEGLTSCLWVDGHVNHLYQVELVGATARDQYYKAIR